jgi:hypothetical protein
MIEFGGYHFAGLPVGRGRGIAKDIVLRLRFVEVARYCRELVC